ncbi:hypothetical protein PMAYCL1PPCAC_31372 [Pristionchus mayeri]|uniref:Uncharacterized protein n=1 Tax=Pristionchus mayeri TaxID=1317129 RepID=A0AAN5DFL3_9BILA|nr:hypothetical protein PMAYCL1PPCAC_31372 [Pristionchus mayeri]
MSRNISNATLSEQRFQVHSLNYKVKEFLRSREEKMNRIVGLATVANETAKNISTNDIQRIEGIRFPLTKGITSNSTGHAPVEDYWPLIPLAVVIISSILFFCYILPYFSWRFKVPLNERWCCGMSSSRSNNNHKNTLSTNPSSTQHESPYIGDHRGWWFEQLRWIRRERKAQSQITRTRESSVRFSTRLKKITYTSNGETHFQELRCLEVDDIAEEVSIHVPESDNDDQDTTVYGDLGRPKTFSDASACSNEIPEVIVHHVPHSDSSAHLHPYRTMSTKSHETRKKIIRPTSSVTSTNGIPQTSLDVRSAWSDPNLAAAV